MFVIMSNSPFPSKPFIVGLAGPSGSGKSTIAKRVASHLNGQVISMESYSTALNHLPLAERAKLNYDEPEAIDIKLLDEHVSQYASGNAIDIPVYDFAEHLRRSDYLHLAAKPLLIVEGILALHFSQLRQRFDLAIYLDAPNNVCLRRRQVRDITERQRPLELIRWQYENTVLPAARRYLLPSKVYANVVLDSGPDLAKVESALLQAIEGKQALAATR
jgi:uridine kinase